MIWKKLRYFSLGFWLELSVFHKQHSFLMILNQEVDNGTWIPLVQERTIGWWIIIIRVSPVWFLIRRTNPEELQIHRNRSTCILPIQRFVGGSRFVTQTMMQDQHQIFIHNWPVLLMLQWLQMWRYLSGICVRVLREQHSELWNIQ